MGEEEKETEKKDLQIIMIYSLLIFIFLIRKMRLNWRELMSHEFSRIFIWEVAFSFKNEFIFICVFVN